MNRTGDECGCVFCQCGGGEEAGPTSDSWAGTSGGHVPMVRGCHFAGAVKFWELL